MQQKVFRIERMLGGRTAARSAAAAAAIDGERNETPRAGARPAGTSDDTAQIFKRQLGVLHDTFARHRRELSALIDDGKEMRMARAAGELAAAVEAMEKATEKILKSTEAIDDNARALVAAIKTDYERGVAQDIQEHAVRIYEACNFQDLAGQRIGKVIATLNMIENQVAAILDRCKDGSSGSRVEAPSQVNALLNGPRLDGDSGHASQCEIDELFG